MKAVYQSEFGEGKGNCLSAAIASILEISLDLVPNFALYGGQFWQKFYQWLAAQNLGMCRAAHNPAGYHLIRVISPRGNFHHELVGYNGKPVHDPYPGGNCEGEFVMFNVIYPLDLSKPILDRLGNWESFDPYDKEHKESEDFLHQPGEKESIVRIASIVDGNLFEMEDGTRKPIQDLSKAEQELARAAIERAQMLRMKS